MQQQQQLQQVSGDGQEEAQEAACFIFCQDAVAGCSSFLTSLVHASVTLHLSSRRKNKWKIVLKKLQQGRGVGKEGKRGEAAENECVLVSLFSLLVASGVGEIEGV